MAIIRLPRLPQNWKDQPQLFERYWDEAMSQLEKTLNAILDIPLIEDALATVNDAVILAQDAADAAAASAAGAAASADTNRRENSLVNSYPAGFTAPLLSANSAGDVTIVSHTRVYGDPALDPDVAVTGDTLTTGGGVADIIRVYYLDPTRAGGAVTYLFTTDPSPVIAQGGDAHSVGAVEIPAAGTNNGNNPKPPGYVEP